MKMKNIRTLVVAAIICVVQVDAQKCAIPEIEASFDLGFYRNDEINPRTIGDLKVFDVENVNNITTTSIFIQYINAEYINGKLRVFTLPEFMMFEEKETESRMTLVITFFCTGVGEEKVLTFEQRIRAVNNFEPEFSKSQYEITIPLPLPPGLDVTIFYMEGTVSAIDKDLQFNQIKFSLSNTNLFRVETIVDNSPNGSNKTTYAAKLITLQQIVRLSEDYEFTLIATDSFNEPKSSSVQVIIKSNPEIITIDPPEFIKALYTGSLYGNGTLYVEDISLTQSSFDENVRFDIVNDEFSTFKLENTGPMITLQVIKDLDIKILKSRYVNVLLKASKEADSTSFATVTLDVISDELSHPAFERNVYEGTFEETGRNLVMDEIVLSAESYSQNLIFTYEGKNVGLFDFTESNNIIKSSLKEATPIEEIMKNEFLRFSVSASKEGIGSSTAEVIIRTVATVINPPSFEKKIYIGNLHESELNIEKIMLTETTIDSSTDLKLEGDDKYFFAITRTGREIKLALNETIKIPETKKLLSFMIIASTEGAHLEANTFISISVEKDDNTGQIISLSESVYEGKLTDNLVLALENIVIEESTFSEEIEVELTGRHSSFFTFTRLRNQITILLRDGLGNDKLPNEQYLLLSVTATLEGLKSASANIVVAIERNVIPGAESLEFNKRLYEGRLTEDLILGLEKVVIDESTLTENVDVQISGRHSSFFTFTRLSNQITILLRDGLGNDELPNEQYLLLSVTATLEGLKSASANIVVAIERNVIPGAESLEFNKRLYEGRLTDDLILGLEKVVIDESTFTENVDVQISGRHSSFFTFTRLSNQITILLRDGLGNDELPNEQYLLLSVTATLEGLKSASANIVVAIERNVIPGAKSLEFNKRLYEGKLTDDLILGLENVVIDESTFTENIDVQISGRHSSFFTFTRLSNQITILLRDGLGNDELPNEQYLLLSVTATLEGLKSASANIVVAIERNVIPGAESLEFNKRLYEGKLTDDLILGLENVVIDESTFTENIDVQISGRHSSFFTFTRLSNQITILLRDGLGNDELPSEQYLLLSVTATLEGLKSASANIVVAIERNVIPGAESLEFNKRLYEGRLTDDLILGLENVVIDESTFTENVDVQISGRHSSFFTFTRLRNQITISLRDRLENDELPNEQYLLLSVTATLEGLKSASANIVVAIERNVIPGAESLEFNKRLYEGRLTDDLILGLENVVIDESTFTENVDVQISGRHSSFFTFTRLRNQITISLRDRLGNDELPNEQYLLLSVTATLEGLKSASANIVVAIERNVIPGAESLEFNKRLYEGRLTDDLILGLENVVIDESTFTENVDVQISGRHSSFFTFTRLRNQITISLRDRLENDELPNEQYLLLSVTATLEGLKSASANIVVAIERNVIPGAESLEFNKRLYEGKLTDDLILGLENVVIDESTFTENVDVQISGRHSSFFTFTRLRNQITISLRDRLGNDELPNEQYLLLSVTATLEGLKSASANIVVAIERNVIPGAESLEFNKRLYEGRLTEDLILGLENVVIDESTFTENVDVQISGRHSSFFTFTRLRNQITISLRDRLENDELPNEQYLLLSVTATLEGLKSASANIVVAIERNVIPGAESLEFNKRLYEGKLTDDLILGLENVVIDESTFTENVDVQISGRHSSFFTFTRLRNQITISLRDRLENDELPNEQYLLLSVTATLEGLKSASANIVVAIERNVIPGAESLEFNKRLYEGRLTDDLILGLENVVIDESTFKENVDIQISGRHSSFFTFTRLRNQITISLRDRLGNDELPNEQYLLLSVTATLEGLKSASANIVVAIERNVIPGAESLEFNKRLYEGRLTDDLILGLENVVIDESTFTENVDVQISGRHSSFFTFTRLRNQITISLRDRLGNDELPNEQYLLLSVTATLEGLKSASANIVVAIERNVIPGAESLEFNKRLYEGRLTDDLILGLENVVIDESTFTENVDVQISGRHSSFFTFTRLRNQITISLRDRLGSDELPNEQYLLLSVTATLEGLKSASANIVVSLPLTSEEQLFKFEKSVYVGAINNQKQLSLEVLKIIHEGQLTSIDLSGDEAAYFTALINGDFAIISLRNGIDENVLLKKSVFILQVIITNDESLTTSTTIIVTLPRLTDDTVLRFEKSFYIGMFNPVLEIIEIEGITLELNNYNETVNFKLEERDAEWFIFTRNENILSLSLKPNIGQDLLKGKVFLSLNIKAERNGYASADCIVFIQLPVVLKDVELIFFSKVNYQGTVDFKRSLTIESIYLHPNLSDVDITVELKGNDAKKFKLLRDDDDLQLQLNPEQLLEPNTPLFFYIEAVKIGTPVAQASIFIEYVDKKQLRFDDLKYLGKFTEDFDLVFDPIKLNEEMKSDSVTFQLREGDKEIFRIEKSSNEIAIKLSFDFNEASIKSKQVLWVYLDAFSIDFYSAETLIIIELPLWSSIPIDECYDTLDPSQPIFETGSYSLTATTEETGLIGRVRALMTGAGKLKYALRTIGEFLADKILVNNENGDLTLLSSIPAGTYSFVVQASNPENKKNAETRVNLRIIEARECVSDVQTTVQKALAIENLEENTLYNTIMSSRIGNCNYNIIEVIPTDYNDIFTIDHQSNFLKNVKPFDREADYFMNYLVPQIQIRLNLVCETTSSSAVELLNLTVYSKNLVSDEILYSKTVTHLNIIIVDQNDNYPIFTNPDKDSLKIGFPDADLMKKVLPRFLIDVDAFDLDEGFNAKIRYSMFATDPLTTEFADFVIDPETGIITPTRTCMTSVDFVDLIIVATDQDGEGNAQQTVINVMKVKEENVIVLFIDNQEVGNIDQVVLDISRSSEVELRMINYIAITSEPTGRAKRSAAEETQTLVFAYAFDEETNLMKADAIYEALSTNLEIAIENFTTFYRNSLKSDCNATGLVVAVSILAGLLLIISVGTPLVWFLWLRNKIKGSSRKNSETSVKNLEDDFYAEPEGISTPVVTIETSDETQRTNSDSEILGIEIDGTTEESTSDFLKFNDQLMAILDGNDPDEFEAQSDKKKSGVRFNEMVERIEVLTDDDDKNRSSTTYDENEFSRL